MDSAMNMALIFLLSILLGIALMVAIMQDREHNTQCDRAGGVMEYYDDTSMCVKGNVILFKWGV